MVLKPTSILQLTIMGFLAVAGVLIVTLVITARQLDGLGDQSQRMISQSATAMQTSRSLLEQVAAMERNARQYSIVGEEDILGVYRDRRQAFADTAQQLIDLELGGEVRALLDELADIEAMAYGALTGSRDNGPVQTYYPRLMDSASQITAFVNEWISSQLTRIQQETTDTKRLLSIQAGVLVGISLLLAAFFTVLISRPLLQIETAINQLGSGFHKAPIEISGPKDLVNLGERLEWLRSRLTQLEQQRSSFLRHVSHELKTPLAAMQESSALLYDGVVGDLNAEQKELLRIQTNNCERLQGLIDELLRYNSESFSVLNTMPEPVPLNKLVNRVLDAHELAITTGRLTIERQLEPCTVQGNPEQLRVALDNLIGNAIKYSPTAGVLRLQLRQTVTGTEFDIIDQGPGIAADEMEKVFDAFYQGTSAGGDRAGSREKNSFKGSGLGLAIAREYVEANGGSIRAIPCTTGAHFQIAFAPADNRLRDHRETTA